MTVERMKRPWNVVGSGFNDDGVYFTFDDTTIHRADVRLMEAAPDLLEALQLALNAMNEMGDILNFHDLAEQSKVDELNPAFEKARAAISKALGEE